MSCTISIGETSSSTTTVTTIAIAGATTPPPTPAAAAIVLASSSSSSSSSSSTVMPPIATMTMPATSTAAASSSASAIASASSLTSSSPPPSTSSSSTALWSKRKRCNSSTDDLMASTSQPTAAKQTRHGLSSAHLLMHQQQQQQATSSSSSLEKHRRAVYVRLADESPQRSSDNDSEGSTYGSFHAHETDICRDTSDTDSYSTEGLASVDRIEYEVPSDPPTCEELYSDDSSSGTDTEFAVTAAQLAHAIFASQQSSTSNSSDVGTPQPHDGNSVGNNDNDAIDAADVCVKIYRTVYVRTGTEFADTEESDAPTDPELGRADYWTCVKCKNKQNNPMYRYCERCYQIRKTHFPPRPKLQKTRSTPSVRLVGGGGSGRTRRNTAGGRNAGGGRSASSGTTVDSSSAASSSSPASTSSDGDSDDESQSRVGAGIGSTAGPSAAQRRYRRRHRRSLAAATATRQTRSDVASGHSANNATTPSAAASLRDRSKANSAGYDSDAVQSEPDMFADANANGIPACPSTAPSASGTTISCTPAASSQPPPRHLPLITFLDREPHRSSGSSAGGGGCDSGFQSSSAASNTDLTPDPQQDAATVAVMAMAAAAAASKQEPFGSDVGGVLANGVPLTVTGSSSTLSNRSSQMDLLSQEDDDENRPTDEATSNTVAKVCASVSAPVAVAAATADAACSSSVSASSTVAVTTAAAAASSAAVVAADLDASANGMCMMCLSQPKNGVFVHSRFLHMCCCYRCAVKVWNKQKRCPICNCKVKTVMKLFVH